MTSLAYVFSAVALLAGVGWLIGREINRTNAEAQQTQRISVAGELQPRLQAALTRFDPSLHGVQLCEPPLDADATCLVEAANGILLCRSTSTTAQSYALSQTEVERYGEKRTWDRVAALTQIHAGGTAGMLSDLLDLEFERHYDTAWKHLQAGAGQNLRGSLVQLRSAIRLWPAERGAERAVALANLAHICLTMPEPETARLPRWLEGYDAAREALRLQYENTDDEDITGLRRLIRELHEKIAGATSARVQGRRRSATESRSPQAMELFATHDDTVRAASAL